MSVGSLLSRLKRERTERESTSAAHARYSALLRERLFKQQLDFIDDPSKFKVVLCARRAGKTTASITYMVDEALSTPGANVVYIALTRQVAKRNVWSALKRLLTSKLKIVVDFNGTELTATFPNESTITLMSCESIEDADKIRGSDSGYNLIIFDESSTFRPEVLEYAIDECAVPTLADRDGTLVLMGTPGRYFSGPFYEASNPKAFAPRVAEVANDELDDAEVANDNAVMSRPYVERNDDRWKGKEFAWSFHSWTPQDNTAVPGLWDRLLANKKRKGWSDTHPIWQREYLSRWIADARGYCYQYDAAKNDWQPLKDKDCDNAWGLPNGHEWLLLLGVDLGTKDAFALTVAAWAPTCPDLYVIDEFAESNLAPSQWAEIIKIFIEKYGVFDVMVGDAGGLGNSILLDFERLYDLHIRHVEKRPGYKESTIELFNDDLKQGRIKIRKETRLVNQMMTLQWKHTAAKKIEDPRSPNDQCDSCLYLWHYAYNHFAKPLPQAPADGTTKQAQLLRKQQEEREVAAAQKRILAKTKGGLGRWRGLPS